MINLILVLGIVIFVFLQIGFKLDERHTVFKFLSLFFAVIGIIILGKAGLDSNTVCSIELNSTHVSSNITYYDYDNYCFSDTTFSGTSNILFKFVLSYVGLLFIYLIVFIFNLGGDYLKALVKK